MDVEMARGHFQSWGLVGQFFLYFLIAVVWSNHGHSGVPVYAFNNMIMSGSMSLCISEDICMG